MVFQGSIKHHSSPVQPCAIPRTSEDSEMPLVPDTFQSSKKLCLNQYNLKSFSILRVNLVYVRILLPACEDICFISFILKGA